MAGRVVILGKLLQILSVDKHCDLITLLLCLTSTGQYSNNYMIKDRVAGVVIGTLVIVIVMLGQINFLPAGRVDHCQMSNWASFGLQSDFGNNLIL